MSWDVVSKESVCPIARTLAVVGDRWTILLLRELSLGVHRFDELQAQTGMSSHLLTTRLRRLEADGVIERRRYSEKPLRYEYHATAKGKELDPMLMLLRSWGRKWAGDLPPGEPAFVVKYKGDDAVIDLLSQVPCACEKFTFDDAEAVVGLTFGAEREARYAAFRSQQRPGRKDPPNPMAGRRLPRRRP